MQYIVLTPYNSVYFQINHAAFLKVWGAPHWWGIETWQLGRDKQEKMWLFFLLSSISINSFI